MFRLKRPSVEEFHLDESKKPRTRRYIDREKIIECARKPDNPANSELLQQLRCGIQRTLDQVASVQDLGNIADQIGKVAETAFPFRKPSAIKYAYPILLPLGITNMWKQRMLIKRTRSGKGLKDMLRRWKIWAAYFRQYRAFKNQCQERKKQYLCDKMVEAEFASRKHDLRSVYNIARSLAPKAPRKRTQLKGEEGSLLSRAEEAILFCEHFKKKFTSVDAGCFDARTLYTSSVACDNSKLQLVDGAQLQQDLLKAPLRKAVPPGHPPSATWRLRADLSGSWEAGPITIPHGWSDAHLVLIKKPGKLGETPITVDPLDCRISLVK